ncbi:hypothetical protein [Bacillus thuringiensis]|uniref:hypothetical protein n=1 Tax=Bacillus thuringiensis TaxID=1428 RepID=UPI0011A9EE06|nr:hypothetical protein [Bacillus thuringiensis]
MNKRMKLKIAKRVNTQRHEKLLSTIQELFTVDTKLFFNGYFVFDMGLRSVCHFTLKETPGWIYGIWLLENHSFVLFGEHEKLIDKFKPSRTYVSFDNNVDGFLNQVKKIEENPKLYFVDSLTYGDVLNGFKNDKEGQEQFVNKEYEEFIKEEEMKKCNIMADKKYAFDFFKKLPNQFEEIVAIGVVDRNEKGMSCYPRYDIGVVVNPNMPDAEFEAFYNKLDKFVTDSVYSKERKTHEHQFDLYGCYDDLKDIKQADYKFYKN